MRKSGKIALIALALLTGAGIVAFRVPESCYISPAGRYSLSNWVRHLAGLRFQECDPFAGLESKRPIGTLSIAYGFEGRGAALETIELIIQPDGAAQIRRDAIGEDYAPVRLTPSDYTYFRDRLAPLRDYAETEIDGEPERLVLKRERRETIRCRSSKSLSPNGLLIIWTMPDGSGASDQVDASAIESISAFDLGCEGPAGPALRARVEPVIKRLFDLNAKWGALNPSIAS